MEASDAVHPAGADRDGDELTARYWIWLTAVENVPLREGRGVTVGGRDIAVFNLGGDRFLAVDNRCPHRGGPLSDGIVAGDAVVCPLHGWKVNLSTGGIDAKAGAGRCVETYPVRVDKGIVVIGLPAAAVASGSSEAA